MTLQDRVTEKEEFLKKISQEISTRTDEIQKLKSEIAELETQGYLVQGALLAYQELKEDEEQDQLSEDKK